MKTLFVLIIFITCVSAFGQDEKNWNYKLGFELGSDFYIPFTEEKESSYFHYSNLTGTGINLSFNNRLNWKKWFLAFDLGHSFTFQNQTILFSNTEDQIITTTLKHFINHWTLNYGLGRKFDVGKNNKVSVHSGFSTIGYYSLWWSPRKNQTGSFSSTAFSGYNLLSDTIAHTYNYDITYRARNFLSPFLSVGYSIPVKSGELWISLTGRLNRMYFTTDITLKSDNYTAISYTKYQAHSLGLSFIYLINPRQRREE